jgi:hypothetical protein
MNNNMKKVLVALRSGDYKQTKGTLQNLEGHCCLGVMCEVYEKETGNTVKRYEGMVRDASLVSHPKVKEWVGLVESSGNTSSKGALVFLNDVEGYSFSQIADFIESEPEGLLVGELL